MTDAQVRRTVAMVSVWPEKGHGDAPAPGVAGYTRTFCSLLGSAGNVFVVLANAGADGAPLTPAEHTSVIRTWKKNSPFVGNRILAKLRELRVDVVHVQHELFLYGSMMTALLFPFWLRAVAKNYPTAVTVHGVIDPNDLHAGFMRARLPPFLVGVARLGLTWIFRQIAGSTAVKIVHSSLLRDRLIEYGANPDMVLVAPHALQVSRTRPNRNVARKSLGLREDDLVVLTWGYDNAYKGFDRLAAGFDIFRSGLKAQSGRAVLILGIGAHPSKISSRAYMTQYERMMADFSLIEGVRCPGFIPERELGTYLSAADVAVFPYTQYIAESGPVGAALGYGIPIIVSDRFPGVAPDATTKPDPDSIARHLQAFFRDSDPYVAASRAMTEHASDERIARCVQTAYERVEKSARR